MDGTSISFWDVTRLRGPLGPHSAKPRRLRDDEPNRLRAIGQPSAPPMDRTESKLFPNGTNLKRAKPGTRQGAKKSRLGAYGGRRTEAGLPGGGSASAELGASASAELGLS
ncbi:hypothetical protein GCM10023080_005970 [Streptomyces pseudoechinosporeus]